MNPFVVISFGKKKSSAPASSDTPSTQSGTRNTSSTYASTRARSKYDSPFLTRISPRVTTTWGCEFSGGGACGGAPRRDEKTGLYADGVGFVGEGV
jgi:hypothetical protein